MKEFAQKLKEYLHDRKDYWTSMERGALIGCETCGDYEYLEVIDGDALWAEIDEFCETFNKDEK